MAVKLPVIRTALGADVEDTALDRPTATAPGVLSRRGLLRTTWLATGVAVVATAGIAVPFLRRVSVLGVRSGDGPQGVPINKSAVAAQRDRQRDPGRLPARPWSTATGEVELTRQELLAMPQSTQELPIACVEGWSASGTWTGVRVRHLLDLVGIPPDTDVLVTSLQERGPYTTTVLHGNFADDDRTLLALALSGEPLSIDHGYPARVIAPNRPGVLQTKWVARIEPRP